MADLQRLTAERYVPSLGTNRSLEKPFFFRVRTGLTKLELKAWQDKLLDIVRRPPRIVVSVRGEAAPPPEPEWEPDWKAYAAALGEQLTFGDEPLRLDGKPIASLEEYVHAVLELGLGPGLLEEARQAVTWFNSVAGFRALFFERLSGGEAFTTPPKDEGAANPTGGR